MRGANFTRVARRLLGMWVLCACAAATSAHAEPVIQARLDRSSIQSGESATLVVSVEGADGNVGAPNVTLPDGIQTLGTSRSQSFSWINGKSASQIQIRIELGADRAGTFAIGPIAMRIGSQVYTRPPLTLTVAADRPRVGGAARSGAAAMIVDVSPPNPYVGQPVILRVRLVQRTPLAEDPQYTPPATPGFWGEKASQPTSYYADENGSRVLVTETRTRLYPLAAGTARVGEAVAVLSLAVPEASSDPFGIFGGGARRAVQVQSPPVDVHVRALPGGAPAGFDGAVGRFSATWLADREETPKDVPVTVVLDVRGVGNLPLLHTPALTSPDAEVFSSTVQDSLGSPGSLTAGRRRFQWTILPRNTGTLRLAAPALAWFDEASGRYVEAVLPAITVRVIPPVGGHSGEAGGFPPVFAEHPLQAQARPVWAWGLAIAGALLGWALRRVRALRARAEQAAAPAPSWFEGLRHARGPSFWAAAGRACETLAGEGVDVSTWKAEIDAARYGGQGHDEDTLRGAMLRRVELSVRTSTQSSAMDRVVPVLAAVVALVLVAVSLGLGRGDAFAARSLQADTQARRGDVEAASNRWKALWKDGARAPGLAARLAWAAARGGDVARAAAWVLRGERGEPRDAALRWTTGQVRDAGGLEGYSPARLPIRNLEWGLFALVLAWAAGWVGRRGAIVLFALAAVVSVAPWLDHARASRAPRAVVARAVLLGGAGVDLAPGQVVRVVRINGGTARVAAGPQVVGDVPRGALIIDEAGR